MRATLAAVVLLLTAPLAAFAVDPPGGAGWYQLWDDMTLTSSFQGSPVIIAGGTPGKLVGITTSGQFRIQFERGVSLARQGEIRAESGAAEAAALTMTVPPADVKAMLRQIRHDGTPLPKGGGPGTLGPLAGGGGATTGAGVGGRSNVGVQRETTVVIDDTVTTVRREAASGAAPDGPRSGVQVFPPTGAGAGGGGTGGTTRVISREEHDARLAKVLALWDEDGARCETKGYGPGWVSVCEPRAA